MPWKWLPPSLDPRSWSLANEKPILVADTTNPSLDCRVYHDVPVRIEEGSRGGIQASQQAVRLARACAYHARIIKIFADRFGLQLEQLIAEDDLFEFVAETDDRYALAAIQDLTSFHDLASFDASIYRLADVAGQQGSAWIKHHTQKRIEILNLLLHALITANKLSGMSNRMRGSNIGKDRKMRLETLVKRFSLVNSKNKDIRSDYSFDECLIISTMGCVNFAEVARNYHFLYEILGLAAFFGEFLTGKRYTPTSDETVFHHNIVIGNAPAFAAEELRQGWRNAAGVLAATLAKDPVFATMTGLGPLRSWYGWLSEVHDQG